MQEIVESPTSPVPQKTMDFPDAVRELMIGKRIQRLEWHDSEYGFMKEDFLTIHKKEVDHNWIISNGDLLAGDWVSF